MTHYTTLRKKVANDISDFAKKLSKGLSKPKSNLIFQIIWGVLTSGSCHLSKIARLLNETTSIKKIVDRLSRNLHGFCDHGLLTENYINMIKPYIKDTSVIIIDGSDITKPYSKKSECLCTVRDGSRGSYGQGYHTLGAVIVTKSGLAPTPVYDKIYSSTEDSFVSEDREVLDCLCFLSKHFSKSNVRVFDRGYDNHTYYAYLIAQQEKFVIRAKKNRNVLYRGQSINILELAKRYKGRYALRFTKARYKTVDVKISIVPIGLPCKPNTPLYLVLCHGFGSVPMMLITNVIGVERSVAVTTAKIYLMRWRIEEFYKFKKQQFVFEDFRVRSLQSIRNLNMLLTMAIGLLSIFCEQNDEGSVAVLLVKVAKRMGGQPKFLLYAVADGLFEVVRWGFGGS